MWLQSFPPAGVVALAPDSVVADGDLSYLDASSWDDRGAFHGNWLVVDDGPLAVELPPALPAAELTLEPLRATWPADGAWTHASLSLRFPLSDSPSDGWRVWRYEDSAVAHTGELAFPDVTTIPGWDPTWFPTPARDRVVSVALSGATGYVGWSRTFSP